MHHSAVLDWRIAPSEEIALPSGRGLLLAGSQNGVNAAADHARDTGGRQDVIRRVTHRKASSSKETQELPDR